MSTPAEEKNQNVAAVAQSAATPPPAAEPPAAATEVAPAPAAAPQAAEAEDEITTLRRERDALKDKNLRLLAELQNQQKRAQREKQETLRFAEFELARELLLVVDDLERTQAAAQAAADVSAVADGVRIVYEHFMKILRGHGIVPIEALGRPFDPALHEAMLQEPSETQPAGTVLREVARGYTMHERVLRPSRVIVSGGAPQSLQSAVEQPAEDTTKES